MGADHLRTLLSAEARSRLFGIPTERAERALLEGAPPVIDAATGMAEPEVLVTVSERYALPRRVVPRFLAAFEFQSNTPCDALLAAIVLLRTLDRDGTRALPHRPPACS